MRRVMVVCAAAALFAAVSGTNVAIARGGGHGGGGHGGGMGHAGGMGHFGGMGRAGFGFGGARVGFATARPVAMFGHGLHRHHPFVRARFALIGGIGHWGYYGCYVRVWTYWGWTWRNVCY